MAKNPIGIKLGRGPLLAIGLMSGTSHDGISAALNEIDPRARPPARVLACQTFPYPKRLRAETLEASGGGKIGAGALSRLNFELGRALGDAAIAIARQARVSLDRVAFIGSHGHTFFHLPPRRARHGEIASTLQLGESAVIAAMTSRPVVADFRAMDLALGGEGAPLAPLAHLWFFADRKRGRAIQNIGGIGNATYLPAGASPDGADVIAFDTGPGVGLIDALASRISAGRIRMDRGGKIAARGRVNAPLLAALMRHPYFRRRPPKSTGREEFGADYLDRFVAAGRRSGLTDVDLMATLTALTARSIGDAVRRFIVPRGRIDQLIVCGGGARNPALMKMLAAEVPGIEVIPASDAGVDGDALEAAAFAILGYQMLRGHAGNLPKVTGARAPAILGKLTLPPSPL
ncbi:MAG: anhydro-N-acetylmuramic acid kinase [Candidatus Binataceae bacterium]